MLAGEGDNCLSKHSNYHSSHQSSQRGIPDVLYDGQANEQENRSVYYAVTVFQAYQIRKGLDVRLEVCLHIPDVEGDAEDEHEHETQEDLEGIIHNRVVPEEQGENARDYSPDESEGEALYPAEVAEAGFVEG